MKKFLGKLRKGSLSSSITDPDPPLVRGSDSIHSESDSLTELKPFFSKHNSGHFINDANLNLNPSITTADSVFTEDTGKQAQSLFSSRKSYSTKQSSYMSNASRVKKNYNPLLQYGQPLLILENAEDPRREQSGPSPVRTLADRLHTLWQDISYILSQYTTSGMTLSTAVVSFINCLKEFVAAAPSAGGLSWNFNAYNNDDVRKILKTYLHFYDNLLQEEAYIRLKLLLCKRFNEFNLTLKSTTRHLSQLALGVMLKPFNLAVGANNGKSLPSEDAIVRIMMQIANSSSSLKEQNGSFIAPISRGISKDMNVLCLYFGYPYVGDNRTRIISSVSEYFDDIHVIVTKNKIEAAAAVQSATPQILPQDSPEAVLKFKLPFRNPADCLKPPMSLSISVESSARVSGTMGGFIYPIIDKEKLPHLASYANSKFAISCGHVCLDNTEEGSEYPYIASPLSVLINLYKRALLNECDKFAQVESGASPSSQVAYTSILSQVDEMFPVKEIKIHDPKTREKFVEQRNLPKHRFGQIIWGERTLVQAKNGSDGKPLREKRLSDLAIIKVNKHFHCDQNYLGDDIAFNEYDPSLMFDNLYVRDVVDLKRRSKEQALSSVNEVDSAISTLSRDPEGFYKHSGLPVFKYGTTTKFTKGNLNGIKLVYWMDGAIHSSEFVVNSTENTTAFAAGGDSGSWILTKLEDVKNTVKSKGLGLIGMLHSYDGEFRQFGLFTPITEILDRLEEVTQIKWGVVGVPSKGDAFIEEELDDSIDLGISDQDSSEDSDYESGLEEQAYPPDID